ncbi:Crp/Fnr family transcriptional regulator [Mucilaginibacter angelicae]|uniref:Crp/Fnr family transcriptional regulator n=1 Tax=Mucilaginibacter angelicae TaxID=869718 RepID=A0ABV6LFH9_9SPHI
MQNIISSEFLTMITVGAKITLVQEGEIARQMFFIKKGCVRVWFNNNGVDVTTQLFFEDEAAASLESFLYGEPSQFTIETLEPCEIAVFNKADFDKLLAEDAVFKDWFYQTALQKLLSHSKRLLTFIKNKPQDRYRELLANQPQLLQRIPQRYLASYLGITTVSLSRIRNRR